MKKKFKIGILAIIASSFITGCSTKDVEPNEAKYKVEYIKSENNGYILKPLQYVSTKLLTGSYALNETPTPVILESGDCKLLGTAKSNDKYTASININRMVCDIDGSLYESRDIQAWVMKNNYVGVDLNKKEVAKRDDQKTSETDNKVSLYGLTPGQEVKIFISEGSLNRL